MAGMGALAMAGGAHADVSGLTKCSENPAFKKRETKEVNILKYNLHDLFVTQFCGTG